MKKSAHTLGLVIAIAVVVSTSAFTFHYQVRLRLLEHRSVVIQPGKGVWVECQTHAFPATLEEVTTTGIVVSVDAPLPKGLPCPATGVAERGERRYFLPFRTVLELTAGERQKWSNPFPI